MMMKTRTHTNSMSSMRYNETNERIDECSQTKGCKLSHFQKTGIKPYGLLESAKSHPYVRRMLAG